MGRGERRGCQSSRLLTAIGQAVFSDIFFIFRDIVQGKKSYFSVSPAPSQLPLVLAAEPCWVLERDGTHAKASFVSVVSTRLLC